MAPSSSWCSPRLAAILLLLTTVASQSYGNTIQEKENDSILSAISEDRIVTVPTTLMPTAKPTTVKPATQANPVNADKATTVKPVSTTVKPVSTTVKPVSTTVKLVSTTVKSAKQETTTVKPVSTTVKSTTGNNKPSKVNGGWSAWSECSKTCNDGIHGGVQTRTCTNPSPEKDGKKCLGSDSLPCNRHVICKTGFTLMASCDDVLQVLVDGKVVAHNNNYKDVIRATVPANALTVEIKCNNTGGPGGFIASSDNGLISDISWQSSSDNGATYHKAKKLGANGLSPWGKKTGISDRAEWIWTDGETPYTETNNNVLFKYTLDKLKRIPPSARPTILGCEPGAERRKVVELIRPCETYVISSPNYPDKYDASNTKYHCHWTIKSQFGSDIKMHTLEANMKSDCLKNELQVYAEKYTDDSKLRRPGLKATCGNNNFTNAEDIITKDEIMVKFKSEKNLWSDKFDLLFQSTPPTNCPADVFSYEKCPSWPDTCCEGDDCCIITAGTTPVALQSPLYPNDSKENKQCKFKIKAPKGSHINLNFLDMDIMVTGATGHCEDSEDYVQVFDESPGQTSIIGEKGLKFCGNRLPNYPGPSVFVSGGNSLTIMYKTGSTITPRGRGFKADVSATNPWCGNTMTYSQKYGDQNCTQTCTQPINERCKDPCCKNKENGVVTLHITVKDKATKGIVKGAQIRLKTLVTYPSKIQNIIDMVKDSNEQGEAVFEIKKPARGDYEVIIDGRDGSKRTSNLKYAREFGSIQILCRCKHVSSDCCLCQNCEEEKEFELIPYEPEPKCPPPYDGHTPTVSVHVTDGRSKKPMPGVKVNITSEHSPPRRGYKSPEIVKHSENATTNSSGIVERPLVFNGNYTVTIFETKRGCNTTTITKAIHSMNDTFNCTSKIPVELKCPWCNKDKKKLTINVMNCHETSPLEDAHVTIKYNKEKTIADGKISTGGFVAVDMIDNGDYEITVEKDDYTTKTFSQQIDFTSPESFEDCSTNRTINICPIKDSTFCKDDTNVCKKANFTLDVVVKIDGTDDVLSDAKVTIVHINKTHTITIAENVLQRMFKVQSNGKYNISAELEREGYKANHVSTDVGCTETACCNSCSLRVEINLTPPCAPPDSSLTLTVKDKEIGTNVDGADVIITRGPMTIYTGKTENGIIETDKVQYTGTYTVKITKDKYNGTSKEYDLEFTRGNCKHNISTVIQPKVCPYLNNITVTITDQKSGNRVEGATVEIKLISSPADVNIPNVPKSDKTGITFVPTKFIGTFKITVSKNKYVTQNGEVIISEICNKAKIDIDLPPNPNPDCPFKFRLSVKHCVTQAKVSKALIFVEHKERYQDKIIKTEVTQRSLPTNDDGSLIIDANQNGEYIFTIDKQPEYIKAVVSKKVDTCKHGGEINVDFAKEKDIIHGDYPFCTKHCKNHTITVTVKEKFTNKKIEGGSVTLFFAKPWTKIANPKNTDKNGVAVITVPKFIIGTYTVKFRHDKYDTLDKSKLFICDDLVNLKAGKDVKDPCPCILTILLTPTRKQLCQPNPKMNICVRNSKDNRKLNGARVTVKIVGCEKPSLILDNGAVDSITSCADVSIETSGTYIITVTNQGFVTQTKTVNVTLSPPCPDLDLNIRLTPQTIPEKNCTDVTVSLTWNENPKDLDLFSWDGCLTYYCEVIGKKPPCSCTNFVNDNRAGGLNGVETIVYSCCEETRTHMIYVDDRSGKGLYLMESGAELMINGRESMPIRMEKIQTLEKPRYWIAGCLTIGKDGYHFEYLNEFTRIPPHIANNQKCKRREKIRKATKTIDQEIVLTIKAVDTENNLISGAQVEVSNNLVSYAGTTTDNGNVDVKVYATGKYQVDVHLNGYISTRSEIEIQCKPNVKCTKDVNIQLASFTSTTDGAKVTLLSDDAEGNTLELVDFKVKIADHTDTCRSSDENSCNGVNINQTFPQMASFSKGDNHGYTNMIIVSCKTENNCGDLRGVKPRVVVVEGKKSQTFNMPEMGLKAQSNSKYWIAGCLKIVKTSFIFVPTDIFVHKDPSALNHRERMYCHNKLQHTTNENEDDADWCDNANLDIKIVHSNTGEIIQNAKATVHHIHDTEEIMVAAEQGLTRESGDKVAVKIGSNGKYLIHTKAPGFYPVSEQISVDCELTKCSSCKPTILISMVPEIPAGFKITMNWDEKPDNLDLIVFQTKKQYVKTSTCLAETNSSTCETVKITATNDKGGYHGGEEVTFDDKFKLDRHVYMVYVKLAAPCDGVDVNDEPGAFSKSNVRLTLTDSTSTSKIIKATDENFDNDKFWFAGCLRAKGDSFHFKPVNIYMKDPPNEVVPEACNEMFNLVIDPSNCFMNNRTVHCENMNDGVKTEEISAKHCYNHCAKTDRCVGFAWEEKTNYCWLKSSMTTITEETGMVSGFGKCTTPKAIDGGWSDWSDCTTKCGGGTRIRRCDNPLKDDDGKDCQGSDIEECNEQTCPTNGGWSDWSACSATCGASTKTRSCTKPAPKDGGAYCVGQPTVDCAAQSACPVNGEWGAWGTCSTTCGTSKRRRTCEGVANGGLACDGKLNGKTEDIEDCDVDPCPIVGVWTAWSDCSKTCGGGARTRQCLQEQNTKLAADTCHDISHTTITCTNDPCPINGGWTTWSACDKTCGVGQKRRQCANPHRKFGGDDCMGDAIIACNEGTCTKGLSCTSTVSTLSSNRFKHHKSNLKNDITKMEVVQKISQSQCIKGVSFGFKGPEAWVDKGCRAKFRFTFCQIRLPTGCDDKDNALTDLSSVTAMKSNGWTLDFTFNNAIRNNVGKKCNAHGQKTKWFGWSSGTDVGTLSATFTKSGVVTVDFGNCWNAGKVKLYKDSEVVATADVGSKSVVKTFAFTPGTVIKLRDEDGNAVIMLNSIHIKCQITCPHKDGLSDVLLENNWKTQNEINAMSEDDKRNTIIVEVEKITGHTIEDLQGRANAGGLGSLTAIANMADLLIKYSIRSSSDVKTMKYEPDLRNTLIVEMSQRFKIQVSKLHGMTDPQLLKTFCTEITPSQRTETSQTAGDFKDGACHEDCIAGRPKDSVDCGRILEGFNQFYPDITAKKCKTICRDKGFTFAGLEAEGYCLCGNEVPAGHEKPGECTMACNGDSTQMCGAKSRINIYRTSTIGNSGK